MVEEKARSLLPRHHFASLSYYIAEYSVKAMTIDAFVAVLLEMLDTYEKVNTTSRDGKTQRLESMSIYFLFSTR